MAALAQSPELLPGISVMWTPPELLCTQLETNFKDALLLVFKRKLLLPPEGKHSLASLRPGFPFPLPHRFSLLWSAAALSASEPLTSPHQPEVGTNAFLLPQSFPPRQRALAARQAVLAAFLRPEAAQMDTLLLLLASASLLYWGRENMVFGEARLAAMFAIQNKRLSWNVSGRLSCFLNKASSHPFYHKYPNSWISPPPWEFQFCGGK